MERELGERLEGRDEVEEQAVDRDVRAADTEERRRRVVTLNDQLLRLHVAQPEVERLVAVSHQQRTHHFATENSHIPLTRRHALLV